MSTRVSILLLLLAIVLGAGGGIATFLYIQTETRGLDLLVATTDIEPGDVVATSMLRRESVPIRFQDFAKHAVQVSSVQAIEGRVATNKVRAGEFILYSHFDPVGPKRKVFEQLEPGDRAFSINVGRETSVANIVQPGDFVDVVATFDPGRGARRQPGDETSDDPNARRLSESLSSISGEPDLLALSGAGIQVRTILTRVPILGVGQRFNDPRYSLQEERQSYDVVTLKVTQLEAEMIVFARAIGGRITLTLRHPESTDDGRAVEPVDLEKFLEMTE